VNVVVMVLPDPPVFVVLMVFPAHQAPLEVPEPPDPRDSVELLDLREMLVLLV